MRILVIGGSRFIGFFVAKDLQSAGHEVVLFNRSESEPLVALQFETIVGDRADLGDFEAEFEKRRFDVVIDMICFHAKGLQQTLDTFAGRVARICVISSMDVYWEFGRVWKLYSGAYRSGLITEESELRPRLYPFKELIEEGEDLSEVYDKIPVERGLGALAGTEWSVLRAPAVFGPRDAQNRLLPCVKRFLDGRSRMLLDARFANWRWTWGYVENVAHAIALCATKAEAAGQIFHVGESDAGTMRNRYVAMASAMAWEVRFFEAEGEALPEGMRDSKNDFGQDIVADSSKIVERLGYADKVSPTEALVRTFEWQREHLPAAFEQNDFDYEEEDAAILAMKRLGREES